MPTYQYRCTECGHDLEAVQKFSDAALTECPNCGGRLRKVFNAVGVVFKGSGFYRNDSRKPDTNGDSAGKGDSTSTETKSDKPAKEPATAGATSSASKSEGKSESKKSASSGASSTASKATST
jgi:putative FmdB family regulatory protein